MQQKEQSSDQIQANFNDQSKEEKIIRRFSWKKIWFILFVIFVAIAALEYFSFQQRQKANEEWNAIHETSLVSEGAIPVYYETFQWYLLVLILAGIILIIVSIKLYFSGMKKAANKVFLKGIILSLILSCLYYLSYFIHNLLTPCVHC